MPFKLSIALYMYAGACQRTTSLAHVQFHEQLGNHSPLLRKLDDESYIIFGSQI